ncbi:MAG: CopD family protein [Gammaproteobacteria bacterium]
MYAAVIALHVLAAVVWVGGMFFAYLALRPALATTGVASAATLWAAVFRRFFTWVWIAIAVLLASGFYMLFAGFGGFRHAPLIVNLMLALGLIMMLLFAWVWFRPYARLRRALHAEDSAAAAAALRHTSRIFLINLILGLLVIVIAMTGAFAFYD